jgi:quercetin dioxygenase-like cupin family protein
VPYAEGALCFREETAAKANKRCLFIDSPKEGMSMEQPEEKKLSAQPANVTDLIEYQEAAVVSRTLIDRKAGTVTLFAFDENQGLSEHTAPFDALVQIINGEAEVTIAGKTHSLKRGEIIIMPARKPHSLKAVKRFKMILTMIRS